MEPDRTELDAYGFHLDEWVDDVPLAVAVGHMLEYGRPLDHYLPEHLRLSRSGPDPDPVWDPALERADVALRALYRLHEQGRWSLLADLGVEPSWAFHRLAGSGGLAFERGVFGALRRDPALVLGVERLLARYLARTADTRWLLGVRLRQALGGVVVDERGQDAQADNTDAGNQAPQRHARGALGAPGAGAVPRGTGGA